jgi:hypothetical protein
VFDAVRYVRRVRITRWLAARLAAPLLALMASFQACRRADANDAVLAITHVTVVNAADTPRPDQTVVVRGRRITAVGASAEVPVPRGARVVDGRGRYLIPGLWDMHVHAFSAGFARFAGPLFVAYGVTGVRDMGWFVDSARHWQIQVALGRVVGPRVVVGGRLDGPDNRAPWVARAANASQARHAVDSLHRAGADFIKVYSALPREAYFAAADAARRAGVPLAGHVPYAVDVVEAMAAGQRSIEHEDDLLRSCSADGEALRRELLTQDPAAPSDVALATVRDQARRMRDGFDARRCAAAAAAIVRAGGWLTPTLVVYQPYASPSDTAVLHPDAQRLVPGALRAEWARRLRRAGPEDSTTVRAYFSLARTGAWHRGGVRLLAGTDAPLPRLVPGLSLHDELALLVRAGLTPAEALRAATLSPAEYLGAADSLGAVARGKVADLVLLDADPLRDIRNTTRIHAVVTNGRYLDRTALDALLAGVARDANPIDRSAARP